MAATTILCSRACSLQNLDKTYTDGMFYVYLSLARFTPKGGGAKLDLTIEGIQGQKRSKANPLLMIETRSQGKPVLRFNSTEDRDAAVEAIEQARASATAPAAAASAAAQDHSNTAGAAAQPPAAVRPAPAAGTDSGIKLSQEQRQMLLASHKALAAQHKALVTDSKALSDDEFWASAAVQKAAGLTGQPGPTARSSRKGLANRLIDLAKQTETSQGQVARLTMTSEDEQQLLAENPALRQLYEAQVPHMMTRGDFWGRYLKYYMAKKAKRNKAASRLKQLQQNLAADSAAIVADMTGDDAAGDETQQLEALFITLDTGTTLDAETRRTLKRRLNPVLDLASAAEDRLTADGYGLAHNAARSEVDVIEGYQSLSSNLLQDYNVHSATVIGRPVPGATAAAQARAAAGPSSSSAAAAAAGADDTEMTDAEAQQYRQNAGIIMEDLQAPTQQKFEELRVTDPRLYFKTMQQQQQQKQQPPQQQPVIAFKQQPDLAGLLDSIDPQHLLDPPMTSSVARQVLQELSSADLGAGGKGRTGSSASRTPGLRAATEHGGKLGIAQVLLSSATAQHFSNLQPPPTQIDELLRHFWGLLPVNTSEKKAKFFRIQKSMDVCDEMLKTRRDHADPAHKGILNRLMKPLWEQLEHSKKSAKNVERELQKRQQPAQHRRSTQQSQGATQ